VKRFAVCYWTVVLPVLSVTLVIVAKHGMAVVLGPCHIVLDGDAAPPKGAQPPPQFSANVCFGQTTAWTMMTLGTEVGFSPGDIVLHGDPAPPKKGHKPPLFGACLLWPNGCPSQLLLSTS